MKIKCITIFTALVAILFCSCESKDLYQDEDERKEIEDKSAGKLVSFKFEKSANPQLAKDIELTIYDNGNVTGYLTHEVDITSLIPTFSTQNGELYYDQVKQTSKKEAHNYTNIISYELAANDGNNRTYKVKLLPYTGLPVVMLRTQKESQIANKIDWIPTHIKIDGMGMFDNYSDSAYVRGRGNATWRFPKRAFNMKLYNKDEILGMPKHKRWCFLANWRDRTLLRNDVTLHIGQQMSNLDWTSKSEFAEVIFNGEHIGNFQVTEHIRVDKNRVNIKEMKSDDIAGEALTGGYLLEIDGYFDEVNKFRSSLFNLPVNIKNPKEDVLQTKQMEYIQNYINTIETYLKEDNYTEVSKLIDIDSFIDFWMVNVLVGNTEIQTPYSAFCYKGRNDKLYAGPLWDFDYSTFATAEKDYKGRSNMHFGAWWYTNLFKNTEFKDKVKRRFAEMKPTFEKIPQYISERSKYLSKSVDLNWELWKIDTSQVYSNQNGDETIADYTEAITRMQDIYKARLSMLETEINNR